MNSVGDVKKKLTYDNDRNFYLIKEAFDQSMETRNSDAQDLLSAGGRQELYRMLSRALEIQFFKSDWMRFDISELNGKRYILDEKYSGTLFGLSEDNVIAWKDIFREADSGEISACMFIAEKLTNGYFSNAMEIHASRYWRIAAEKGDVIAMYNLGMCYRWGEHGEYADPDQALFWFKRAADAGYNRAGDLVESFNDDEGKNLFFQSAISGIQGFGTKWYKSKWMVEKYFEGANAGDAEMQYELARESVPGTKFDAFKRKPENAVKYYELASGQGMVDAMFNLANLYEEGCPGMEPDLEKAFLWRKKCADARDAEACYLLGRMYQNGRGTARDVCLAKEYLCKSSEKGFQKAVEELSATENLKEGDKINGL